jgi:oligopeptide/dipeptide ABC transporter ATP-binding protein
MINAIPLLEARNLTVRHPAQQRRGPNQTLEAVQQLNLALSAGEIVAIVGESGCGKSSLAKSLLGLLPAASGAVLFRGVDVAGMTAQQHREWHRAVQLIFQDPHSALSPRRTIQQTLEEPLQQVANPGTDFRQKIHAALQAVNLSAELLPHYPHQLSGGQKQRVALARALLCEPELIVADEPLSALDVSEQARMLQLLRTLREHRNIGFLLIAHDLAIVQQVADRVGVMYLGRLVELAGAAQFFRSPAHPYSRALLQAAVSNWDPVHSDQPVLDGEPPSAMQPPSGCVFHPRCKLRLEQCASMPPEEQVLPETCDGLLHRVQCHLYPEARNR